jgi:hypothetical protein
MLGEVALDPVALDRGRPLLRLDPFFVITKRIERRSCSGRTRDHTADAESRLKSSATAASLIRFSFDS